MSRDCLLNEGYPDLNNSWDSDEQMLTMVKWPDNSVTVFGSQNTRQSLFDAIDCLGNPGIITAYESFRVSDVVDEESFIDSDSKTMIAVDQDFFEGCALV